MAIRIVTSSTTGINADANLDLWVLRKDILLSSDDDAFDFLDFAASELIVEGAVYSLEDGVDSDGNSFSNTVHVTATGTLLGVSDGIEMQGASHRVTNLGDVSGLNDVGVEMIGNAAGITNHGTIYGYVDGVSVIGLDGRIDNHGTITAELDAIEVTGSGSRIINTGILTGGRHGVEFQTTQNQTNILINQGQIIAGDPAENAIRGDWGRETVFNSGVIIGNVGLSDGADIYDGRGGSVVGSVFGGAGDDTLTGGDTADTMRGGQDNDLIRGGLGNDSLTGSGGDDTLNGGAGDDSLHGSSGRNLIYGGLGNDNLEGGTNSDTIRGGTGDDVILGGDDSDILLGQKGDDVIFGDGGLDIMNGGAGNDTLDGGGRGDLLNGGAGNDLISGSGGADTFLFDRLAGDDIVTDMKDGDDRIDLTAFGLKNFNRLYILDAVSSEIGGVHINLDALRGSGSIWLEGFSINDLDASDFII